MDSDGGFGVVEGYDNMVEGFERCKGMDWSGVCDEVVNGLEIFGEEDIDVVEVGEEEGVGWRGWLGEWW